MLDSFRCFALKHLALLALQTANILETVQGLSSFVFFCQISSSTIPYKSIMYNTDVAKPCKGLPCRPDRALLNHPLGCPRLKSEQQQTAQMHALMWQKRKRSFLMNPSNPMMFFPCVHRPLPRGFRLSYSAFEYLSCLVLSWPVRFKLFHYLGALALLPC